MRGTVLWTVAVLAGVVALVPRVSSASTTTLEHIESARREYLEAQRDHEYENMEFTAKVGGVMPDGERVTSEINERRNTNCLLALLVAGLVLSAYITGASFGKAATRKWPMIAAFFVVGMLTLALLGRYWSIAARATSDARAVHDHWQVLNEGRMAQARKGFLQAVRSAPEADLITLRDREGDDEVRQMLEEELERRQM